MEQKAIYHLPGLFEFYDLYRAFLPLFYEHREYFYDWCEIGSVYGAPGDCLWGGGRAGFGADDPRRTLKLMNDYGISSCLTFSNLLLQEEHLCDKKCNDLCAVLNGNVIPGGVIVGSELLLDHLRNNYPNLYYVSSTTKVLTDFDDFLRETRREEMRYIVPDFRLNKQFERLKTLSKQEKDKTEFLCNECCPVACRERRACYEAVSRKNLGDAAPEHLCAFPEGQAGYRFSRAMESPAFIGLADILQTYLPMGFSHFKIEGRGLGSAMILEFLLYYMTKPEYQLRVREAIYLDGMLDLF